jgi:hypothetical protein
LSWLDFFRRTRDEEPTASVPTPPGPAPRARAGTPRPKAEPASGYGANPYDTYTWELHNAPDGERELKRAHLIDKRKDDDTQAFNPYDTGKFSGGW